jgi:hypothetical protein
VAARKGEGERESVRTPCEPGEVGAARDRTTFAGDRVTTTTWGAGSRLGAASGAGVDWFDRVCMHVCACSCACACACVCVCVRVCACVRVRL